MLTREELETLIAEGKAELPEGVTFDEALNFLNNLHQEDIWTWRPGRCTCITCNAKYKGQVWVNTQAKVTERFVGWCPECLNPDLFWAHAKFKDVVKVESYE
jgi:hypothetical protein